MKRLLEKLLNLTEEDIFKPYSLEEVLQKRLKDCTLNSDGTYSSEGNVNLSGLGLTILPVKFKEVKGYFDCSNNQLTSLEGSPIKVSKGFWCAHNKLTSLEGCPKEVGGGFDCYNNNLTSLEGAPEKVAGSFHCSGNELTSLKGAPREVGLDFWCGENPVSICKLKKTVKRDYL